MPGVTDNVGKSATEALHVISKFAAQEQVQVYSGRLFFLYGDLFPQQVETIATELLANTLIEEIKIFPWSEFNGKERFANQKVPEVVLEERQVKPISLDVDERALEKMSKENFWALNLSEMLAIKNYFYSKEMLDLRVKSGLPEHPTDVEVEMLAQTWSEHCKHKIFAAEIDYTEEPLPDDITKKLGNFTVKGIFKNYIKKVTEDIREKRKLNWLVSVFSDNAGIVRFYKNIDLCIKVETHNSPSALDPYGGALTGIVGVNRDILGCGMGARPIANTDVFCFAQPDTKEELPEGLKHPRRIFEGVHLGVEDGGNKSGIPTVNGAIVFDQDYAGKPLVFCGTIGAMPQTIANNIASSSKGQKSGHRIVMAGGRIGKDGIHGATFSSMELSEGAPATVVQIGDPITQKRLGDFLIEARDLGLFSSVTDNGAGGLSSSIGEMAQATNGAMFDLIHAPVKYPGLAPFELLVSESQERMTFAVAPEKLNEFMTLAARRNVEACDLGEFTSDGFIRIYYKKNIVGLLSLDFLHDGLPQMVLKAKWTGSKPRTREIVNDLRKEDINSRAFYETALYKLLSGWNIRSKEPWVRRYDHEVQASTIIKPFVGIKNHGPSDGAVLWLAPHGGEKLNGIAVACGIAPRLSAHDTYVMAQHALDEALRNLVAVGADPDQVVLVDNFCWPDPLVSERNPDAHYKLAQLVRASHGLYDLALAYGAPFVSGKDSMKNDFIGKTRFGKDLKISVPPTVLVTAMGRVPQVERTITSEFKNAGDLIFLIGKNNRGLAGSELLEMFPLPEDYYSNQLNSVNAEENLKLYRSVFSLIGAGILESCHDCSEGGMLVALAEAAIGSELGVRANLEKIELSHFEMNQLELFFNETPGRFLVSVKEENVEKFKTALQGQSYIQFGTVTNDPIIRIARHGLVLIDAPLKNLTQAWRG